MSLIWGLTKEFMVKWHLTGLEQCIVEKMANGHLGGSFYCMILKEKNK